MWRALLPSLCLLAAHAAGPLGSAPTPTNHWSLRPLIRPSLRAGAGSDAPAANPIDRFLDTALADAGLVPAPPAGRRAWLRRVTFDLTGLPPTPEESRAFVGDRRAEAETRVIDRLLASPHYGERWARHWLDAAHYAESHGHDQDRIRTNAWPYRDHLVARLNADQPYARFIAEQIAGDLLFPDDPEATLGLGFLAAGPWDESSLRDIREDTLDRQAGRYLDRDDMVATVMNVVTGTTVQCARCHDHKFDPVPQVDYYALQAVFAGVERADRVWDADPSVHRRRQQLMSDRRRADRGDTVWLESPEVQARVAAWVAARNATPVHWQVLAPQLVTTSAGTTLLAQTDGSFLATGPRPEKDTYVFRGTGTGSALTAVRLEALTDPSLPEGGPGRAENGNLHLSEFLLEVAPPDVGPAREVPVSRATADFDQDGWDVARTLDRDEATAWGIHPREGTPHVAVLELREPLLVPTGSEWVVTLKQLHGRGHLLGRVRLAVTGDPAGRAVLLPEPLASLVARPAESLTPAERRTLAVHVVRETTERALSQLPTPRKVYAAAADFAPDGGLHPVLRPRVIQVLNRGEITKPGATARPGALACLAGLDARFPDSGPDDEGPRRAALARWLTDPANVLTWRTIVNRVWHHHFGRGLANTPNDLGRMGGAPSHPGLLDWLAVWFRDDAQGSLKALHRLIVTSQAYRRSTLTTPEGLATDPDNRWLAHMSRHRLEAECVRDAVLQIAGRLDFRMGGPGDHQFDLQPGIHVTPRVDYTRFDPDDVAGARRSVYRFLFRTLPDPFMDALDCPAGDQTIGVRDDSVSVQQALSLWNHPFMLREAEHFGERIERSGPTPLRRVRAACEWVWGRPPLPEEERELTEYALRHGWANVGRLLFNSSEFLFVD